MSSHQDSSPLVISLQRLLATIEERPLGTFERETSYIIYDFDINQSILKSEHKIRLDELVNFLDDHLDAQIVSVIGRASQTGAEANNENLAFIRAETARDYLTSSGISSNRIGPTISSGSKLPIVDSAGSELSINRSVEIVYFWSVEITPPPTISAGTPGLATRWHIDLSRTFGFGAVFIAGQVQFGTLTNRTTGISRKVEAFIFGPELGKSIGPVASSSQTVVGLYEEGNFETPYPVNFDYFDGQPIALYPISGTFVSGGSATKLVFPRGRSDDPSTRFASIETGFTFGIGGAALYGILNVHDE